tara:strand:+ start:5058 stop:6206 length:1149 start_codon:yes stop_codon:yes gene_type:complete
MKKSQLKKIIRESIKQLITEQYSTSLGQTGPLWISSYPNQYGAAAYVRSCDIGGSSFNTNFEVDGPIGIPQNGQIFAYGAYAGNNMVFVSSPAGVPYNYQDHYYGQGGLIDNPNVPCPTSAPCSGDNTQTWAVQQVTSLQLPGGQTMNTFCPNICTVNGTSAGYGPNSPACSTIIGGDDEPGCIDPLAINHMQCCPGNNYLGCVPNIPNNDCCRYEGRGSEDKGCTDPNATNYNVCCNGDPNCTVVGSNPECCKYDRRTGDERGCIDPNATNNGECCPGNNYPGCVATLHHEPCCKYEGGGEEKKCTCCKKIEGGTIQGISMATQIPISDSCSQFNNPPLLYGCTDSTLWSLSKCSQELPNDDWPIGLDESIIRMQKLANIK